MPPFLILLALRMMALVMTTGAVRHAKIQSNHPHQQTITQLFLQALPVAEFNSVKALKGKHL